MPGAATAEALVISGPPRVSAAAAPADGPHLGAVQALLTRHDELLEQTERGLGALQNWAGPGLDGRHLGRLCVAPHPPELEQGVADLLDLQEMERTVDQTAAWRHTERQNLELRLTDLLSRAQTEQEGANARLEALRGLQPAAQQVLAAQHHLKTLAAQRTALPRGGLVGLWRAVSGQATALQREVELTQHAHDAAARRFQTRVRELGLPAVQRAEDVTGLVAREAEHALEAQQRLTTQRQALEEQINRLNSEASAARRRLEQRREQVTAEWQVLSQRFGVPADGQRWAALWDRREAGQHVWQQWHQAEQQLAALNGELTQLWQAWPADQQNVGAAREWLRLEALRLESMRLESLRLAEETALAQQQAAEAQRRVLEREAGRLADQQRRSAEERLAAEHAAEKSRSDHLEARQALLSLLVQREAGQRADRQTLGEAKRAAERDRDAQRNAQTRPGARQPLPAVPQTRPEAQAQPAEPSSPASSPVPHPATPRLDLDQQAAAQTLLRRHSAAAAQAAMCAEALQEWAGPDVDGVRLGKLVSEPLPPALQRALAGADPGGSAAGEAAPASSDTRETLDAQRLTVMQAVDAAKAEAAARLGPLRLLRPAGQAVIDAEHELAKRTSAADSRAADTDKPSRHARRLHDAQEAYRAKAGALGLTPAPRPADLTLLIDQEEKRFQVQLRPLNAEWLRLLHAMQNLRPEPPSRRRTPASGPPGGAAWSKLALAYGLPPQRRAWDRLWAGRVRAQTLWAQWERAQQVVTAQEAAMALLWAAWPTATQNVAGLRHALELTPQAARTEAVDTPPRQAAPQVQPRLTRPLWQDQKPPVRPPAAPAPQRQAASLFGSPRDLQLAAQPAVQPVATPLTLRPTPPLPGGLTVPVPPPAPRATLGPVAHGPLAAPVVRPAAHPAPQNAAVPGPAVPGPTVGARPHVATAQLPPVPRRVDPPRVGSIGPRPSPVSAVPPLPAVRRMPTAPLPGQGRPPVRPDSAPERLPGKLTRRQRAEREAARLSDQYNWKRGFVLLADALDREHWGRLRESIEREIADGMTPEEFELVLQLRAYWHEQIHFQSPYTNRYDSLPWGLGLNLIRRCAGVPCLEEMTILIERLYDYAEYATSRRALPGFSQRLGAILTSADPDLDLDYWLHLRERG